MLYEKLTWGLGWYFQKPSQNNAKEKHIMQEHVNYGYNFITKRCSLVKNKTDLSMWKNI